MDAQHQRVWYRMHRLGVLLFAILWGVGATHQRAAAEKTVVRLATREVSTQLYDDGDAAVKLQNGAYPVRHNNGADKPADTVTRMAKSDGPSEDQQWVQQQQQQHQRRFLYGEESGSGGTELDRGTGDHSQSGQQGDAMERDKPLGEVEDPGVGAVEQHGTSGPKQEEENEMEGLEDSPELDASSGISKNVLVIVFCALAFVANGGFLVYVFWVM